MSTTVVLKFPAHRYHGTPWGRHVNEGEAEWPPSPYRLLRALYDAWHRKCRHLPKERVESLLAALAGGLPRFWMPKAVAAHTRSYLSSNTENPADKSLIFDAFVALAPDSACFIEWPVSLAVEQRAAFVELLEALNYLGRSESWVDAGLAEGPPAGPARCVPVGPDEQSGELVQVACAVAPSEYSGKPAWFDALAYSTHDMLKQRRSIPPAMRNVPYVRDRDAVATWLAPRRASTRIRVSGVRLALSGKVLPLATETVWVAERLRAALIRKWASLVGQTADSGLSPTLFGKDRHGNPLEGHRHLFVLPRANDQGRIGSVLLYCNGETFTPEELEAIRRVRLLPGTFEEYPVRVVATWAGAAGDETFRPRATAVRSVTPFATVRHWRKGRGEMLDFLREEIRRECRNHGLDSPVRIECLEKLGGPFLPVEFRRNRRGDPPRPGYAFRMVFPTEVRVPFSLGYACHFGLGQFDAIE